MNNSIFSKNESNESDQPNILSKKEILESIPKNSTKQPDLDKQKTMTEWRWRFYKINNKMYTEISKSEPNSDRIFVDNTGNWIKYDLDDSLNSFIVDQYYYYSSE